ncbi:MAG: DNA-binding response regulator, partial [Saprospiraceae bacterium]|nr:DNA-binding response regulator [Saprospiraceae bacterium]
MHNELIAAVQRTIHKQDLPTPSQINLLADGMREERKAIRKIAISISDGIQMLELDDILYFESDGNYTTIFLCNEQKILVS